jgi:hypothetical protein
MNNPNRQELPMPSLENLDVESFRDLLADLSALGAAADTLEEVGLTPVLHLVPGERMGLTVERRMPEACDAHAELFAPRPPSDTIAAARIPTSLGTLQFPSPPPEQTPADAPPVACEAAAGGAAEAFTFVAGADPDHPDIAFQPAGALSSSPGEPAVPADRYTAPGGGGAEGQASPEPAADPIQTEAREKPLPDGQSPAEEGGGAAGSTPATASASHERSAAGTNWTDAEDARLIEIVASSVVLGAAKSAGIRAAAKELGRPEPAIQFRTYHKLKDRIDARIAEMQAEDAASPAFPEIPAGQPAPEAAPAATAGEGPGQEERVEAQNPPQEAAAAGAVSIQPQAPIHRHLDDLPRLTHGRRWTEAEDADLLRCVVNGMKLPEISADLQLDAGKIKARIAVLTERHSAEKMLAALEARLPQAAE